MDSLTFTDAHTHHAYAHDSVLAIRNYPFFRLLGCLNLPIHSISGSFHPAYIPPGKTLALYQSASFWNHSSVRAVGECGLDTRQKSSIKQQSEYLEQCCFIAQQHQLPLILHTVKAYPETLHILSKYNVKFMFHQYSGTEDFTKKALDKNAYFSFGFELLHKNRQERIKQIPPTNILLESDAVRKHVSHVFHMSAEILSIPLNTLTNQVLHNFTSLYSINA